MLLNPEKLDGIHFPVTDLYTKQSILKLITCTFNFNHKLNSVFVKVEF